jgi:hypothetical protein
VLSPIVKEQRFGATLALVVAGAGSDRINITPINLRLRVHGGIAIDLARRGLQHLNLKALGETEHIDGTDNAGLGRLDRISPVMDRGGRAREIENLVHLYKKRMRDVVTQKLEALVIEKMFDISP